MLYNTYMNKNNYNYKHDIQYFCRYHVLWCTKYKRKVITENVKSRLEELIKKVLLELDVELIEMQIDVEHVYIIINVEPVLGVHKTVKAIKRESSSELRKEFPELNKKLPTLWSNSYFVSTDAIKPESDMKEYIENQKISERKQKRREVIK